MRVCDALDYLDQEMSSLLRGGGSPVSARGLDVVVVGAGSLATDCAKAAMLQGATTVEQIAELPDDPGELSFAQLCIVEGAGGATAAAERLSPVAPSRPAAPSHARDGACDLGDDFVILEGAVFEPA